MPKALTHGPYRFFFWSREANEPPHVHVKRKKMEVKFWIDPVVELADNSGFARHEVNEIYQLTVTYRERLLEKWHEHFDQS